jgi:hypothetical protein
MFMNLSFQIVPVFKKSRARSSRLCAGLQNKGVKLGLASSALSVEIDSVQLVVQKQALDTIKEYQDGGHSIEIIAAPFKSALAATTKSLLQIEKPLQHRIDVHCCDCEALVTAYDQKLRHPPFYTEDTALV